LFLGYGRNGLLIFLFILIFILIILIVVVVFIFRELEAAVFNFYGYWFDAKLVILHFH
jgi:hypothetical protein